MNILWVASEAYPYAKTGGLADVSASLPKALSERGHKVAVVMPCYPQVMKDLYSKLEVARYEIGVPMGVHETRWCRLLEDRISDNLSYYFVEHDSYYDRPSLYDWQGEEFGDNAERFIFLSRAAMQVALTLKMKVDILHANDWHAALCCVYQKSPLYQSYENFASCKSVLTIHNMGYQGIFDKENFYSTGLDWDCFDHSCLEYHDKVNFLKAGIMCADRVNTVSPTYSDEILSPEFAFNLEGPLQHADYLGKLSGILNGIDVDEWNPGTDSKIPANYSINDMSGKAICKAELQKEFGLPQKPDVPLFGVVSRLAMQKGLDVFAYCIDWILHSDDVQFVVLGSGDHALEARLSYLAETFPDRFAVHIGYNDRLSHMVEAGCDMFVMPSRYEPCGLNQMYSMRYGTVPLVRGTGGLEDTVINYEHSNIADATGFKFYDMTGDALARTILWAMSVYRDEPENFRHLQINGMMTDFSWDRTAGEYEKLYDELV